MINNSLKLKKACDEVLADKSLRHITDPNTGRITVTYCNFGVYSILQKMHINLFYRSDLNRRFLAAEMYQFCDRFPNRFPKVNDKVAKAMADYGLVVLAATMGKKGIKDEHVAIVYPNAPMVSSGKWKKLCPQVANIGKKNEVMGTNWAFGKYMPDYFVMLPF